MPKKKETTAKKTTKKKDLQTAKELLEKDLPEEIEQPTPIISESPLDLKFEKVNLRDVNDIYVALTDEKFSVDGKEYDGKEHFLVMFGAGQLFAVQKAFFKLIAQIMPT